MSFVRHRPDTVQIRVRYVPAPVTGTVFVGTGTVWKIPTRGIPVPNPNAVTFGMTTKGTYNLTFTHTDYM